MSDFPMNPAELLTRLREHPIVRRMAWLGFLSLIGAVTLTGYVFGLSDGFWGRAFPATLVFWLLAAGTVFGIRPLIVWLTNRLAGSPARAPRARKTTGNRPAASRAPSAGRWR